MPEQPLLSLQMDKARMLYPKAVILIILGVVLYFGVWINLKLLKVASGTRSNISLLALIVIGVLIIMELLLGEFRIRKDAYKFYENRVEYRKKVYYFGNVRKVYFKRNFFDRIFKTGGIVLSPVLTIKNIPDKSQIFFWVQKLVERGKSYYY
jgi:hypothetical protein